MSERDHTLNPHLEPSNMRICSTWNGLGIKLTLNNRVHDPETELMRAFVEQHLDSDLVLVPAGGYSNNPGGVNLTFFEIRKSHPQTIAQRKWWRRLFTCLSR